jgi:predicted transcriptional regulator
MTLRDIKDLLKAEVISGEERLDDEVCCAGGSDLMSDVLAFSEPGLVLLTGLRNNQSVRTANIIDAKAIVYVRGKKPDAEGLELAEGMNIPILSTKLMMYCACGILYKNGLPGVEGL